MKLLIKILFAVVILIVLLAITFNFVGDYLIKVGIETAGTKALNVGVDIDSVDLSIFSGKMTMKNFTINNPAGFEYEHLLKLGDMFVSVEIGSLFSDTIKIELISLDGLEVVLEQKGLSSNLDILLKSVPKKSPEGEKKTQGKKLVIAKLQITNITVKAKLLPLPGRADTIELKLDPITMTNLGSDSKLDTSELVVKILASVSAGIVNQGANKLPSEMLGGIKQGAAKTVEQGKKILESGKDVLGKGKDFTESIKKLFK